MTGSPKKALQGGGGGDIRKSQQHTREFVYGGEIRKNICVLLFRHYFYCSLDTIKRGMEVKNLFVFLNRWCSIFSPHTMPSEQLHYDCIWYEIKVYIITSSPLHVDLAQMKAFLYFKILVYHHRHHYHLNHWRWDRVSLSTSFYLKNFNKIVSYVCIYSILW